MPSAVPDCREASGMGGQGTQGLSQVATRWSWGLRGWEGPVISPTPSFQISSWIRARRPHPGPLSTVLAAPLRPVFRTVPFRTPGRSWARPRPLQDPSECRLLLLPGPMASAYPPFRASGTPAHFLNPQIPPCPALGEAPAEPRQRGARWCCGQDCCRWLGSGGRCSPRLGADLSRRA